MKPAPFSYHDPKTLDDALGLLASLENAKLLAGGQSLVSMLNMRYVIADHLIDLNKVSGLSGVEMTAHGLKIGAMTRQRALERDATVAKHAPIIQEALTWVGHMATRSRGTFGGSLSHLDPAAELPAIALLYDADLEVASKRGRRSVPAATWNQGYMTPALEPDEMLISATLKVWQGPHGYAFLELARRHGDFAMVGVGALLAVDGVGTIQKAAVVVLGATVAPVRLTEVETMLKGRKADAAAFAEAGEVARKIDAMGDVHVGAGYRQQLAATLTKRALAKAAERARG